MEEMMVKKNATANRAVSIINKLVSMQAPKGMVQIKQ
jgi:hypothetical protein